MKAVIAENRAKRLSETEQLEAEIEELKAKIPGLQEFGKQLAAKIDARKTELETKEKKPE
ncbi:hypothetical protein [Paenibacillus planticolens]|nr:hypothetical protein [Paenibacillus planticolens]